MGTVKVDTAQIEPPTTGQLGDEVWQRWFSSVYQATMQDGGSFPKINIIGKEMVASGKNDYLYFQALHWNCGHYADVVTSNGNIVYGFAAKVQRQSGNAFTVGAQLDALGGPGATSSLFGCAIEAIGQYGFKQAILGLESSTICFDPANLNSKWAFNPVFKDRPDGAATVTYGLGANQYNYFACANVITSQARSGTGENCGFTVGHLFAGDCFDNQVAPAWNASTIYSPGMIVTSGGLSWECYTQNSNQTPMVPSAYWRQHTVAGTAAPPIGIDFTAMGANSLSRMASLIRLVDFQKIHFDVTGAIGTYYDSTNGIHVLNDNNGTLGFGIFQGAQFGVPKFGQAATALVKAATGKYLTVVDSANGTYYLPLYQ